jgi:hypothetical protein
MELLGLLGICWCVLSGPGELAVGNYEEDGAELMKRSKQWRQTVGAE